MKRKYKLALGASIVAFSAVGGIRAHALSVQDIANAATPVANEYGLYPSVMIAQGILESSHGQSSLANTYNNIFGVKYYSGSPVYLPTQEYIDGVMQDVMQPFQSYSSLYEACLAQAQILRGSSLYSGAWRENTYSYLDATAWLQGRYATDPAYASKLNALISEYGLTAYDNGGTSSAISTSTSSASGATYTVKAGDSLSAIAANYGTTVEALVSANGLANANAIREGQVLTVSSGVSATSQTRSSVSSGDIYVVQSGDSLSAIAQKFGTTVSNLLSMNQLSNANSIHIGEKISVPSAASSETTTSFSQSYTVQAGDSIYSIAQAHGMSAEQLAAINGIELTHTIQPGQTLQL
ncbi:LysM peptidoglycan-binding domain-containing protein [Lactococcus nasutitermitis]|uniref:Peptidoglycan hydrolase n=1 Tax=Lactococcus nasutitermitis TaxID=1652957 RepID=A0ABV9JB99_9LACT|nr:LysM peptidoglycan-binding domain-containing protein [Lactococcus nasutitermitis]